MSIKANINSDSNGDIIIQMSGTLNYDTGPRLRLELEELIKQGPFTQFVIDMFSVDFVGSSGIRYFIDTMKHLQ